MANAVHFPKPHDGSMVEERKSPRCPTSASRHHCVLKLGSVILPAMLLDESSSGFGVLVNGLPSISANQRVQLRTNRSWFDCRIVHVTEVVPPKAAGNSAGPEKELFEGDITVITTDCNACEVAGEDDGATKHITADDIKEFMTQGFTVGTEEPWFRLGIRCLGSIAPPAAPATALPGESGSLNPLQWIKSMLKARRKVPSQLPALRQ